MAKEVEMNRATSETFKSLEHHSIADVAVRDDTVELAIPESEGWRLVISAALDEGAKPILVARWEPGLRRSERRVALRRLIARHPHRPRAQRHPPARRAAPGR
jgi:hypothetical protein